VLLAHFLKSRRLKTDPRLKSPRGDFVQHGREESEVFTADESHFDRGIGGKYLFEVQRRVQPAETAAENHDPGADRGLMVFPENVAQPKVVN